MRSCVGRFGCRAACVFFAVIWLAGCANNMGIANLQGRYGDVAAEADRRKAAGEDVNIHLVCVAYAKVRRYQDVLSCLDKEEASIRPKAERNDPGVLGIGGSDFSKEAMANIAVLWRRLNRR